MRHVEFLTTLLALVSIRCEGLHINGVWDTSDFFHYVTRFGFQKAIKHKELETQVLSVLADWLNRLS